MCISYIKYIYIYVCMYVCMYVYIYIYIYIISTIYISTIDVLSNPKPGHPTGGNSIHPTTTRPLLQTSKLLKQTILDVSAEAQTY